MSATQEQLLGALAGTIATHAQSDNTRIESELARLLVPIVTQRTGMSSSGFPYLERRAWEQFRDHVPHTLSMGERTLGAVAAIRSAAESTSDSDSENIARACRVIEQIVTTAAITAPPSLWLARHLLGCYQELGLLSRLLAGKAIYPNDCRAEAAGTSAPLASAELSTDVLFFLSLGFVEQYDDSYRIAGHPRVRRIFESVTPLPTTEDPAQQWLHLFRGESLEPECQEALLELGFGVSARQNNSQNHWIPTLAEIELGYRLVPVVVALRASGQTAGMKEGSEIAATRLSTSSPLCAAGALEILTAAGWCTRSGECYRVTRVGERGLQRGPGPFGIIHTYHPYMTQARNLLTQESGQIWVERGDNVAASQDANSGTFRRANDALDRFTGDTGFPLTVFIEHAIGRGEATRQRYERSGDTGLRYVGADLEDAAIDAALEEQAKGHLPEGMVFVRNADIGKPDVLLAAMRDAEISPRGAVMIVGNGFHEIRNQTDASMQEVFRGYCEAGVILLFTEENALAIDDIRQTAWNTYHAAFKYVHEKSGQGLRPANPRREARLGTGMRAAWSECALAGGYVRAEAYCGRTRTIYPYTPESGINPSISVNHFFVPRDIAEGLGIAAP